MNVTMAYLLEIVVGVFRDYGCGIESYITIHARKPGATTNELTTTTGFGSTVGSRIKVVPSFGKGTLPTLFFKVGGPQGYPSDLSPDLS